MPSTWLSVNQSSPFLGLKSIPTELRTPRAKTSRPEPSALLPVCGTVGMLRSVPDTLNCFSFSRFGAGACADADDATARTAINAADMNVFIDMVPPWMFAPRIAKAPRADSLARSFAGRSLEPFHNTCWARCALKRSRQAAFSDRD